DHGGGDFFQRIGRQRAKGDDECGSSDNDRGSESSTDKRGSFEWAVRPRESGDPVLARPTKSLLHSPWVPAFAGTNGRRIVAACPHFFSADCTSMVPVPVRP